MVKIIMRGRRDVKCRVRKLFKRFEGKVRPAVSDGSGTKKQEARIFMEADRI